MYALLYPPGHKGALFAVESERKSKTTHPCVEADTEERTISRHFITVRLNH